MTLPRSEFLDQGHIRTVCTRRPVRGRRMPAGLDLRLRQSLDAAARPTRSKARSSCAAPTTRCPTWSWQLQRLIDVDVVGRIDSVNGGIRTTFERIPDQPVSKFTLTLKGGGKGLLVNSTDLCGTHAPATVLIDGQNGATGRPAAAAEERLRQEQARQAQAPPRKAPRPPARQEGGLTMSERSADTSMNGKTMSNMNGGSKSMGSLSAKLAAVLALARAAWRWPPRPPLGLPAGQRDQRWASRENGKPRANSSRAGSPSTPSHMTCSSPVCSAKAVCTSGTPKNRAETVFGREDFFGYFGVVVDPEQSRCLALNATSKRMEKYLPSRQKSDPGLLRRPKRTAMALTGPEGHFFIAEQPGHIRNHVPSRAAKAKSSRNTITLANCSQRSNAPRCPAAPYLNGPVGGRARPGATSSSRTGQTTA